MSFRGQRFDDVAVAGRVAVSATERRTPPTTSDDFDASVVRDVIHFLSMPTTCHRPQKCRWWSDRQSRVTITLFHLGFLLILGGVGVVAQTGKFDNFSTVVVKFITSRYLRNH